MKQYLITMLIALSTMTMVAEASPPATAPAVVSEQAQPAAPPAPVPAVEAQPAVSPDVPATATTQTPSSDGMFSGILLGLGLGALLASMGIGVAMAGMISSILLILLLAMTALFMYRMLKRKDTPANPAFTGSHKKPLPAGATPEIGSAQPAAYKAPKGGYPKPAPDPAPVPEPAQVPQPLVPAGFDSEAFLLHAKASFIRMQAAWDKADTDDLRQFTTPEVFAELNMQIQDRGDTTDCTEVVSIDAELLGIEAIGDNHLASVKFVGLIKPSPAAEAAPFAEVWNMSRPLDANTGWALAGIQQLS